MPRSDDDRIAELAGALIDRIDPNCYACREARSWADQHAASLVRVALEDSQAVLRHLARGRTRAARVAVAQQLRGRAWRSYMRNTTRELRSIRDQRVRVMRALRDLGRAAAMVVGRAGLAALERR